MVGNLSPVVIALIFLLINMVILYLILLVQPPSKVDQYPPDTQDSNHIEIHKQRPLKAVEILSWEFEYARTTASEAMQDRHTMMNFYLLVVGIVGTGVIAVLSRETDLPPGTGTILMWLLVVVGWLYFLKLIRLRQAWHDSAQTMNRIKDFYFRHGTEFDRAVLSQAFRWQPETLPPPGKPWTVFFYSAALIALLNSVAYLAGGFLLDLQTTLSLPNVEQLWLILLGLVFFAFHIWLYFAFLKSSPADTTDKTQEETEETLLTSTDSGPDDSTVWVKVLELVEDYSFDTLFRIVRAKLQYRRFDGQLSEPITRISLERGDSVGVLLYDPADEAVILVRQFRYPVYASLSPDEQAGAGARQAWLLEIVAGVKDAGLTVTEVAHKELLEETGYEVKGSLQPITTFYPSAGGSSERIALFLGEVDQRRRVGQGGGIAAEGEDIELVVLPFSEALAMIVTGEICDAKTIIALQHLALDKVGTTPGP